ncbi:hypothetical protein CVV43_01825 [Candidatus Saccharibacteria bacterium HGW-Saccharibacteria-1]|nr:MAG: hypothetical protein CVV43_01825 [Candidatus Saccharibacteria bacterium HGW-Saccharibacteria-1]
MSFSSRRGGFALPTVLISSIIMLMVLLSAASSTSAVRTSLKTQYYNQLSGEAADAGVVYAKACIANEPTKTPGWTNDKPLKVNTDCKGDVVTACTDGSIDPKCSVVVTDDNRIIATFSVPVPPKDSDNKYTEISATGRVVLLRSNDSSVWREFKQTTSSSLYSKLTGSLPEIGTTLANCTWKEIKLIAEAGLGDDYFNIGDTKDLTLTTGETLTMQIYDFNHDDKSDGSGKANITFGTKDLMASKRIMNNPDTNVGGWDASQSRAWINTTLYNTIPSYVQSSIKPVIKKTSVGYSGYSIINSIDKLFLFSEVELFGSNSFSYYGEGTKYPIFTDNASRAKKQSGIASEYWLRSPSRAIIASTYDLVDMAGNSSGTYATVNNGICFGFAIGNSPRYSVIFNSQGGSAVTSQNLEVGEKITEPTAPTKLGSVFAGWYKEASYTNAWNFSNDTVTANTTLYAKWLDIPAVGTPLESFSWEQIAYISEHGQADTYFDVGNTKNITISGESLVLQIYDFNHDNKSDSSGKAGITFGLKDATTSKASIKSIPSNEGGWDESDIRTWTNGSLFNSLPTNLQTAIKPVNKISSGGYQRELRTSVDKIFLFSEIEVFGAITNSYSGEGVKYPIFDNSSNWIKTIGYEGWWMRSASAMGGTNFFYCFVRYDNVSAYATSEGSHHIVFGFAI